MTERKTLLHKLKDPQLHIGLLVILLLTVFTLSTLHYHFTKRNTAINITNNWQTYHHTQAGYSFKYPPNWQLTPSPNKLTLISDVTSLYNTSPIKTHPSYANYTIYFETVSQETLDSFARQNPKATRKGISHTGHNGFQTSEFPDGSNQTLNTFIKLNDTKYLKLGLWPYYPKSDSTTQQQVKNNYLKIITSLNFTSSSPTPLNINYNPANWTEFTNHHYNFSFKYPDELPHRFSEDSSFTIATAKLHTQKADTLYVKWIKDAAIKNTDDYLNQNCHTHCDNQAGKTTIGEFEYTTYTKQLGDTSATGYITTLPNNTIIDFYSVDFPESLTSQIIASLTHNPINLPAQRTVSTNHVTFTFPSHWNLSKHQNDQGSSATVSTHSARLSTHLDNFRLSPDKPLDTQSLKDHLDYVNNYKFSSTAWYGDPKIETSQQSERRIAGKTAYSYTWQLEPPYYQSIWYYLPLEATDDILTIELQGENLSEAQQILSSFQIIDPAQRDQFTN